MLTAAVLTPHAYASGFIIPPPTISPNPAVAGQPITVSGSTGGSPANGSPGDDMFLFIFVGPSCATQLGGAIGPVLLSGGTTHTFSFTTTISTPGPYCLGVSDSPGGGVSIGGSFDESFTVTAASPIPEYPLGIPILAIFMIIAYGVIRRKTRNDYA